MQEVIELNSKKLGVEEGKNIESYLSQDGRVKAKLIAPLMLRYQLDTVKVEFPKKLHVDFFDDSLKIQSQLNARYGSYMENIGKVFLKDSVTFLNRDGDTLWCKEMWWDQNKHELYSDKPTRIFKKQYTQRYYSLNGFRSDEAFTFFTLFQSVNGTLIMPDSSYY